MGLSRRQFTRAFKLAALRRLDQGEALFAVSRALEVAPPVLCRWREEFRKNPAGAFPGGPSSAHRAEDRIPELERKVGQQALEIDFLKGCLQRIDEQRMLQASTGNPRSSAKSAKKPKPGRD